MLYPMPDVSTREMFSSTAGSGLKAQTDWPGRGLTDLRGPGANGAGGDPPGGLQDDFFRWAKGTRAPDIRVGR